MDAVGHLHEEYRGIATCRAPHLGEVGGFVQEEGTAGRRGGP